MTHGIIVIRIDSSSILRRKALSYKVNTLKWNNQIPQIPSIRFEVAEEGPPYSLVIV